MWPGRGFTLVELMVVVLILGVLAAITLPRITEGSNRAKINACKTNIDIINKQIELYHAQTESWPPTLKWFLENHPGYFPDGSPRCPFGKAYIIDIDTHRVIGHTHILTIKSVESIGP